MAQCRCKQTIDEEDRTYQVYAMCVVTDARTGEKIAETKRVRECQKCLGNYPTYSHIILSCSCGLNKRKSGSPKAKMERDGDAYKCLGTCKQCQGVYVYVEKREERRKSYRPGVHYAPENTRFRRKESAKYCLRCNKTFSEEGGLCPSCRAGQATLDQQPRRIGRRHPDVG